MLALVNATYIDFVDKKVPMYTFSLKCSSQKYKKKLKKRVGENVDTKQTIVVIIKYLIRLINSFN